jgi:hypothetical protein
VRSEGETALAQSERERQTLSLALSTAQREAQTALCSAMSDHQEELERLASEKVSEAVHRSQSHRHVKGDILYHQV